MLNRSDGMQQLLIGNTTPGCQVGGHLEKGGKRGHFTGKGGQKEDIFFFKLYTTEAKKNQIITSF